MSAPCKVLVPTPDNGYQFVSLELTQVILCPDGSYKEHYHNRKLQPYEKVVLRWVAE